MQASLEKDRYGGTVPSYGSSYWFKPDIFRYLYERGLSRSDIFRAMTADVTSVEDLREELIRNCRRLSPPYDEAAWQYFVEERTPAEIAERLGLKLKTAQTRISRAREKLKEIYGKTAEGGRSR